MDDKTLGAYTRHEKHAPTYWKGVVREYKDALEKAVRERDEALADAESRPLTPADITDEMVERGRSAYWGPTYGGSVVGRVRAILAAALTEPPARPEGAEELGELIGTWTASEDIAPAQLPTGSLATLADFLAERGVRAARRDEEKR